MIFIVEDDALAREAIGELIESLGFRAATFASAEQFLQSGRVDEVACLITDLQMPGMNGLDLQNCLRAEGYEMPIVFISAFAGERERVRALKAGAVAFLRKPLQEQTLIDSINSALATRQK